MNILLTGSSGNLGSHLMKFNTSIAGVGRHDWQRLDDKMQSTDVVIHAAYDLKNPVSMCPSNFFDSNLSSTMLLLESMARHRVPRLYFISSCAVYGDVTHMHEDASCAPVSINGMVKHLNEAAIESFCLANGIKFTFLRLFNLYAGNDEFSVLHKLKNAVLNSGSFQLNNDGLSQRDFIHVEDAAKIILRLVDLNPEYECINVGSGNVVKIVDLFNVVKKNHPSLEYTKTSNHEIEYARADNARLLSLVQYEFPDVLLYADQI